MNFAMNATAEIMGTKASGGPPGQRVLRPPQRLLKALDYARKITDWIAPHCRQVEAVGEIRRREPIVNTIELLVIPRFEANANSLFEFLHQYAENELSGMARWLHSSGESDLRGLRPSHYDRSATLLLPRCTLVLQIATAENWFLRLFETTGSRQHVVSIMDRVRSLPGSWEPGEQIRVRGKTVKPLSEGHIYEVLNMSLVPPWNRV